MMKSKSKEVFSIDKIKVVEKWTKTTEQRAINHYLYDNIKGMLDFIRLKFDVVIIIDGMEGSGKSELGKQICLFCNENFNAQDVFYTVEQFEEWVENAKPGSSGLWDEFVLAGLSTDALTKIQNVLIKKFTMMRKKRLIVVLIIPYIFMLRKYFAVARTRCLIHTFTRGTTRGYFEFYDYLKKQWVYNYGFKTWLYSPKVIPNFYGRFSVWADDFIDSEAIEDKKDEAMKMETEDKITLTKRQIQVLNKTIIKFNKDINKPSQAEISTLDRFKKSINYPFDFRYKS